MRTLASLFITGGLFLATPVRAQMFVNSCTSDADCADAQCVDAECVPYDCYADSDCGEDALCDVALHECVSLTPEAQVALACPCDAEWKNHGQYVRCVVFEVDALALEPAAADEIVATAAQDDCGQ